MKNSKLNSKGGRVTEVISSVEKEREPLEVALVACMDDALKMGQGVAWVGLGGSFLLPRDVPEQFAVVKREGDRVYEALKKVASKMNLPLEITSHEGCGWCNALEIPPEEVEGLTEGLAENLGLKYKGHIRFNETATPAKFGREDAGIMACIKRREDNHIHEAKGVVFTVNGFITQGEIEKNGLEDCFVVSADWVAEATKSGMEQKDVIELLSLQLKIANNIMKEKYPDGLPVKIFRGEGFLEDAEVDENIKNVRLAILEAVG